MIALRPESKKQIDEGISQTQLGTPEDWFTDILSSFEDDIYPNPSVSLLT